MDVLFKNKYTIEEKLNTFSVIVVVGYLLSLMISKPNLFFLISYLCVIAAIYYKMDSTNFIPEKKKHNSSYTPVKLVKKSNPNRRLYDDATFTSRGVQKQISMQTKGIQDQWNRGVASKRFVTTTTNEKQSVWTPKTPANEKTSASMISSVLNNTFMIQKMRETMPKLEGRNRSKVCTKTCPHMYPCSC